MRLFQAALDTPLDSPFSATLSVHGLHFTVYAPSIWPFFTQISGRNFLPELCGEVHPRAAPLQALFCTLFCTEQSTFWGEKRPKRCREKGRKRGGQQRGAKGKKDARKQVRFCGIFIPLRVRLGVHLWKPFLGILGSHFVALSVYWWLISGLFVVC